MPETVNHFLFECELYEDLRHPNLEPAKEDKKYLIATESRLLKTMN